MKRNLFIIIALSLVIFACGSKETSTTAQDYHSTLIAIQTDVDNAFVDLMDAIDNGDEADILSTQEYAETVLADALKEIEDIGKFDGTDEYKKEMIKLLSMYEDILENELAEIIDYTIYFDDLTDEEWEYYYSVNDSMMDKYEKAHEEFVEYQDAFSVKWEFALG